MEATYIRLPEVVQRYKISRSTLYSILSKGEFPQQVKIGRSSLWNVDELNKFDQAKLAGRLSNASKLAKSSSDAVGLGA